MVDYRIINVRIFEGTNSRGVYRWAQGELLYELDPYANPEQLPLKYMLREDLIKPWLKCAALDTAQSNSKVKVYVVNDTQVNNAVTTQKFADGSDCCILIGGQKLPLDFAHAKNVKPFDVDLVKETKTVWAKVAVTPMTVKVLGKDVTINPGEFIPGKTGTIVPRTTMRVYISCMPDGTPVENPIDVVNGILERRYKPLNVMATPTNAPGAPTTAVTQPSPEEQAAEAAQVAAEQQVLGLGQAAQQAASNLPLN